MIYKSCAKEIADMIVSVPTHKYRIQTDDRGSYVGEISFAISCVFSGFKDYDIFCKTEERAEYELASKIARFLINYHYTNLNPKLLHEAVVEALAEVGVDAKSSLNVRHRKNFDEIDRISRYSIVGAIDERMARKKEYAELHRSPIEKRLDRIIELLERKTEPKEKESYDPKKHGDLKNYIRQRQMEYGIYAIDKTDEHISKVVEEIRESYDDFLGLRGRQ